MESSPLHTPTRIFLILLRLAIGWHFAYEGWSKLETHHRDTPAGSQWSAQGFLRNASGPLAPYYRRVLTDPDFVQRLNLSPDADPEKLGEALSPLLTSDWDAEVNRFIAHYSRLELSDQQKQNVQDRLAALKQQVAQWLMKAKSQVADYEAAVKRFHDKAKSNLTEFEIERLYGEDLKGLRGQRDFFAGKIEEWDQKLQSDLRRVLNRDQRSLPTPTAAWRSWDAMDWINHGTPYGLLGVGLCLMFGFLTRIAALLAALFLASVYLAVPPWPGLPGTEAFGGHYYFVNLQLIEMLAVLAVAGSGRWAGIDALIHAIFFRKRKPKVQR